MPTWYYKGMTPAPVDTIDRGSVVVTRGKRFQATEAQVARLLRAGLVVRMPEPQEAVVSTETAPVAPDPVAEVRAAEPLPRSLPEEEIQVFETSFIPTPGPVSDQDMVEESKSVWAHAEAEEAEVVPMDADYPSSVEEQKETKRRRGGPRSKQS